MNGVTGVRARFADFEAFKHGLKALKDSGQRRYEAFGPTNLTEIEDLMPKKESPVRILATSGAIVGLVGFWAVCAITSLIFALIVGGKPPISNLPYIIPAYEGTILLGSIMAFIAGLIYAALRPKEVPSYYDPSFSRDTYGILVWCGPSERSRVADRLREAGAEEVHELD